MVKTEPGSAPKPSCSMWSSAFEASAKGRRTSSSHAESVVGKAFIESAISLPRSRFRQEKIAATQISTIRSAGWKARKVKSAPKGCGLGGASGGECEKVGGRT